MPLLAFLYFLKMIFAHMWISFLSTYPHVWIIVWIIYIDIHIFENLFDEFLIFMSFPMPAYTH